MRLLLNFISQMLCSSAKTQDITHLMLTWVAACVVYALNVKKKWSSHGKVLHSLWKSGQRNFSWAQRSSWRGSTEHQSAHIRHIYLLLRSRPSGWTGFIFYEQQLPAQIKWLLWPRLVSSAGGGHRPGVSPEGPPDWTSQIRESSSKEVNTGCTLKQHFENNVKFKQHWPVNIIIIIIIIIKKKLFSCFELNICWFISGHQWPRPLQTPWDQIPAWEQRDLAWECVYR